MFVSQDDPTNVKIARKRRRKGMTQAKLAKLIGVTQKDVSRWENGMRKPRAENLAKIAAALGCSIEELI